jgi:hypothetical protein
LLVTCAFLFRSTRKTHLGLAARLPREQRKKGAVGEPTAQV